MEFSRRRLLPEWCKPVSVVKLDETRLGLRVVRPDGERMTMPLDQATFAMLLPRGSWTRPR
jgi:hypothetical protein